ncbi:heat shock protein HslJ [Flavobacterium sp. PL11]|uniref:META domain-containing protein n=1 Tax=Flavobacterium sp. PL11 TaxID=3071717 RepID=UPI002E0B853E|nr:heat shock protein HslJ [Flavobacterium sp. PL11]
MKAKLIILIITIFSIVCCNTIMNISKADNDNNITEKYWKLKTLQGRQVSMTKNQEREIFITLKKADNTVIGFAGCNILSGSYTLDEGNRINFRNVAVTIRACPDVNINESEFLEAFELADNYTIVNDVLTLNIARAPLAVFEAVYMN